MQVVPSVDRSNKLQVSHLQGQARRGMEQDCPGQVKYALQNMQKEADWTRQGLSRLPTILF